MCKGIFGRKQTTIERFYDSKKDNLIIVKKNTESIFEYNKGNLHSGKRLYGVEGKVYFKDPSKQIKKDIFMNFEINQEDTLIVFE